MKQNIYFIALAAFVLLFSACRKETQTAGTDKVNDTITVEILETDTLQAEPEMEFTDWEGEYRGILPCEDCDGAETVIALYFDSTFTQNVTYIGRGGPYESRGTFTFEGGNLLLKFEDGSEALYKVEDGVLKLLDEEGEAYESDDYTLRK